MKLFTILCLFCLHTAMAKRTRIRVYKHSWDSKNYFSVEADMNTASNPATITVTKHDLNEDETLINFEGFCALLQEVFALRPSNVPSSSYIYFRVCGDIMRATDIEKIDIDRKENSLTIVWKATAAFRDEKTNYLMDIGDGGPVVGIYAKGSMEGPDDIKIDELQVNKFGTTVKAIHDRLVQAKQVFIGGPCFQIVEHKFLNWTVLDNLKLLENEDLVLHFQGDSHKRKKFWIKKFGEDKAIQEGTLLEKGIGKMEFHMNDLPQPMLVLLTIRNGVQDISTGKVLQHYKSGLCLSVSEEKSPPGCGIDIPDRLIFGFTGVEVLKGTKNVVVTFDWLENADGSSYMHAIKLKWGVFTVFLNATIYFDSDKKNGVAVVQENKQTDGNKMNYLQNVYKTLQEEMKSGVCKVVASGPLVNVDVDYNGKYDTPLTLTVERISNLGVYSFEIVFST